MPRNPPIENRGDSIESTSALNNGPTGNTGWNHSNPLRAQTSNSGRKKVSELQMTDTQDHTGYTRDNSTIATAFSPLSRSLDTSLTRVSRTNERNEKSKRLIKKPRCYKGESEGCIDT